MNRSVSTCAIAAVAAAAVLLPAAAASAGPVKPTPRNVTVTSSCSFDKQAVNARVSATFRIANGKAKPVQVRVSNGSQRSNVGLSWYKYGTKPGSITIPMAGTYFVDANTTATFATPTSTAIPLGGSLVVQVWNSRAGACQVYLHTPPSWS